MGLFRRKKFEKLKRQDVVDSIIELNNREASMEQGILEKQKEISELFVKGKNEKNQNLRLFYAKKINSLKQEIDADTQRIMYLLYNVNLLNKLKNSIEDNDFFMNVSGQDLNRMLSNQKDLAMFLNKSLNRKINAEEVLTTADDIFNEVASAYEPNEKIYDTSKSDDEALAIFELDDAIGIENGNTESSEPQKIKETKEEA